MPLISPDLIIELGGFIPILLLKRDCCLVRKAYFFCVCPGNIFRLLGNSVISGMVRFSFIFFHVCSNLPRHFVDGSFHSPYFRNVSLITLKGSFVEILYLEKTRKTPWRITGLL